MRPKKLAQEFLLMTLGTALVSVGVYFFKFPNNFSTGGVSGISTCPGSPHPLSTPSSISCF